MTRGNLEIIKGALEGKKIHLLVFFVNTKQSLYQGFFELKKILMKTIEIRGEILEKS